MSSTGATTVLNDGNFFVKIQAFLFAYLVFKILCLLCQHNLTTQFWTSERCEAQTLLYQGPLSPNPSFVVSSLMLLLSLRHQRLHVLWKRTFCDKIMCYLNVYILNEYDSVKPGVIRYSCWICKIESVQFLGCVTFVLFEVPAACLWTSDFFSVDL